MKKALMIMVILLLPAMILAGGIFGELGLGYRTLSDSSLNEVYGSGAMQLSFGIGMKIGHPFTVLLEGGYYRNAGKTTGLEEATTMSYIPFMLKGRYNFVAGEGLRPFAGVGVGYIAYRVDNESEGLEDVSEGSFGMEAEAGVCYRFQNKVGLVLKAGYLYSKAKPFGVERNLGGLLFSAGVRVKF